MESARFLLRPETIRRVLTRSHLTHQQIADHLGLSRGYWSRLYNRHRSLTPTLRRALLDSRYFAGLAEDDLWEMLPAGDGTEVAP